METITFTATFTFPKESVLVFAKFLQYEEYIMSENGEGIDNPESPYDYIAQLAKEHNESFATKWAEYLANEELQKQIAIIKPQIDSAIIEPVKQAIQVTYSE
jgi:hypothetical protein